MNMPIRNLLTSMILMMALLILPMTGVYAGDQVKWKTFKEKSGLYTINYPSNWIPQKIDEFEGYEITSPINMYFVYSGGGSSGAIISITADESIFTNATDSVDSIYAYAQSLPRYKLLQPMECGKYVLKEAQACSTIISYKNTELSGKPIVSELDIVTIDEEGVEYVMAYIATKGLFDDFLPVAEEMVKSFSVTGDILSTGEESAEGANDSPNLPPLKESPTFQKL
ncbi:MAG: hypothetical protein ACM3ZS_11815 [Nitrososphaerota archaeon]